MTRAEYPKVRVLDLTHYCTPGRATVDFYQRDKHVLRLVLGAIAIVRSGGPWRVSATIAGAADCDNNNCKAASFELTSVQLQFVMDGWTHLDGWVRGDLDSARADFGSGFRVPEDDADPREGAPTFRNSKYMFLENHLPPHNVELYELTRGARVRITIGGSP